MSPHARTVGQHGERLAERFLTQLGARLLARNYRVSSGEIDLVFEDEGELVAVEVKTRLVDDLELPVEAVKVRQLGRIANALTTYAIDANLMDTPWRIDVVAIRLQADGRVERLDHLRSVYPA